MGDVAPTELMQSELIIRVSFKNESSGLTLQYVKHWYGTSATHWHDTELNCCVTPGWTIKNSTRKSWEGGKQAVDLINEYSHLGNSSTECFHFAPTEGWFANWVTWAQWGSCQASRVFICAWLSNHGQGSGPRGDTPISPFKVQLADKSLQKLFPEIPVCEVIRWHKGRGRTAW